MQIAFQCRAKPQGCDAVTIFEEARRVFIGYPLGRKGVTYDPHALRACLVDPCCADEEWTRQITDRRRRSFTRNRNFIPSVTKGSIVVIPRPGQGAAYLGRIHGPFEIVNAPRWAQAYLDLRDRQGLDVDDNKKRHIADVAQGWRVDEYRRIDLSRIPGWIRRSLLGRSTYNRLRSHPLERGLTAHDVLDGILAGADTPPMAWSLDPQVVKRRLVDTLSNPCAFENLVVALLQLEHPHEIWNHSGGPGDGGIDGFGSNDAGEVVAVMQAKYYAAKAPKLRDLEAERPLRRYTAVLLPENPAVPTDGSCLLNLAWIADAVLRHWRQLPMAQTMRIGQALAE